MEIRDIYDINKNVTGRTTDASWKLTDEEYQLSVHICVFNKEGKMLIQKRKTNLKTWKGRWDITAGGLSIAGEESYETAEREFFEELGIKINLKNIRPHMTINFHKGFDDLYLIEQDLDIDKAILQEEEVEIIKWVSKEEIIDLINTDEFIPYYPSFIELVFDMKQRHNTIASDEKKFL